MIKSLFCSHKFKFVRNIYGDEIIGAGFKRSLWKCDSCNKYIGKDQLYKGRMNMVINKSFEPHESVIRLVQKRSYMFTCGFKTAWDQYVEEDEKRGLTYEQAYDYWLHS